MPIPGTNNGLDGFPLLSIILFLPTVMALVCWTIESTRAVRLIATVTVIVDFILAIVVLILFEIHWHGESVWVFQFADHLGWINSLGISYWVGVDGVSVFLVGLATLIAAVAMVAANYMIAERARVFAVLVLFLETAVLGTFMSLNLFLFFVFWEAMLIPSYFLLGMWGESGRVYATIKFVVYTVAGSFLMLVAIFYLWSQTGTLDMPGPGGLIAHPVGAAAQTWLFLAFGIAFAIKIPLFPFHTWAPSAYTESPTPFVLLLAGILSKAGAFGLLRYCLPLFPAAAHQFQGIGSVLAIIGMLYAASLALVQTDIKRLVAYASISHMNLIALGIFSLNATAFDGSVLQMINHSVIITGLFLAVAYLVARTGTRQLSDMGGLGHRWPILMWTFFVFILAGLDLPGLSSFSGEFLILVGVFKTNAHYAWIAALVVILAAWYMIRFFQNTMNGPTTVAPEAIAAAPEDPNRTAYQFPVMRQFISADILPRELVLWIPLMLLIFYIGVQPDTLTSRMNDTTAQVSVIVHGPSSPGLSLRGGGR